MAFNKALAEQTMAIFDSMPFVVREAANDGESALYRLAIAMYPTATAYQLEQLSNRIFRRVVTIPALRAACDATGLSPTEALVQGVSEAVGEEVWEALASLEGISEATMRRRVRDLLASRATQPPPPSDDEAVPTEERDPAGATS